MIYPKRFIPIRWWSFAAFFLFLFLTLVHWLIVSALSLLRSFYFFFLLFALFVSIIIVVEPLLLCPLFCCCGLHDSFTLVDSFFLLCCSTFHKTYFCFQSIRMCYAFHHFVFGIDQKPRMNHRVRHFFFCFFSCRDRFDFVVAVLLFVSSLFDAFLNLRFDVSVKRMSVRTFAIAMVVDVVVVVAKDRCAFFFMIHRASFCSTIWRNKNERTKRKESIR